MTGRLAGRVVRLGAHRPPPAPRPGPALDRGAYPALSAAEFAEAAALWAKGRPALVGRPLRPSWDLEALDCAELDRLGVLLGKGGGRPQAGRRGDGPCVDCRPGCPRWRPRRDP